MKKRYLILLLAVIVAAGSVLLFSLKNSVPDNVSETLKAAGRNQQELKKVIAHYEKTKEKKKLAAVYFLFANMQDRFHYEGKPVEKYRQFFTIVDSLDIADNNFRSVWDSLVKIYTPNNLGEATRIDDITTLKGELLIQHIDAAFKAWNNPWSRQTDFETFCEYILPYKVADENPEPWINVIQQKYQWLYDSMGSCDNPVIAARLLNRSMRQKLWINSLFNSAWDFTYSDLDKVFSKIHTRGCFYSVQYTAYILRSMGLPVAIDFTPYWANKSSGHEWNALIVNGRPLPFIGTESDPGKTKVEAAYSRKRAKVFRNTFSLQEGNPYLYADWESEIPPILRSRHLLDVTADYEPVSDIPVKLDRKRSHSGIAYLCVFNGDKWKPVHWAPVDKNGNAVFKNMGREIAYLPMYYDEGEMIPAGAPLVLRKTGKIDVLAAVTNDWQNIIVKSKSFDGVKVTKDKDWALSYWDASRQWVTIAKKFSTTDLIEFKKVPRHALLIVHSNDKPETERIFTYENGEQKFW